MPTTTQSLAITAVLAATACSTSYVPRTPGRLFVTMDSGKPSYVRDGQRYDHGILGGGLQEAVRGNPRAEAAAAEYRSRMSNGLLVMVVGAVCTSVAIGSAIADESGEYDPGADRRAQTKLLVATAASDSSSADRSMRSRPSRIAGTRSTSSTTARRPGTSTALLRTRCDR